MSGRAKKQSSISIFAQAMLGGIRIYQLTLSSFLGRGCRYLPSCSEYASDAIRQYGAWRGGWLGFSRICRCHPLGGHGFDPVPDDIGHYGVKFWRYGRWRQPIVKNKHTPQS